MITGLALAVAHLVMCLALLGGAGVSAFRSRYGARTSRRGSRYHRLTTQQMMKRLERYGTRGKYSPNGL